MLWVSSLIGGGNSNQEVDFKVDMSQSFFKHFNHYKQSTHTESNTLCNCHVFREMNPAAASSILASVRKTLKSSPFMFEDDYARIISGEEEGLSSWVTVNYLYGSFNTSQVCGE